MSLGTLAFALGLMFDENENARSYFAGGIVVIIVVYFGGLYIFQRLLQRYPPPTIAYAQHKPFYTGSINVVV